MKLQNHSRSQILKIGGASHRRLFVFLALLFLPLSASGYSSFSENSKHNFVDNGYTGGGVCSECHAAGGGAADDRLFRWDLGAGGTDPGMCQNKCHSPAQALPTDSDWLGVTGVTPPVTPHTCVIGRCESCHDAKIPIYRCLDCHKTGAIDAIMCRTPQDYDSGSVDHPVQTEVAKFFTGIAGYSSMSGLLSSHDITYNEAGNLATPADNECLKCHGLTAASVHPGVKATSPILRYPDDPDGSGVLTINGSILRPTNSDTQQWNDFYLAKRQTFCLACHDGSVNQAGALITLGGHAIPAVPPFKFDLSAGDDSASTAPYFANSGESANTFPTANFFEGNGHGRSHDRRTIPMNLTCLGEEVKPNDLTGAGITVGTGCHSAHGSKNYSLIRDGATDGSVNLGTGVDTAQEMSTLVCLGCHSRSVMRTYKDFSGGGAGVTINTGFHVGWGSGDRMSHFDGACDTVTSGNLNDNLLNGGGVFWRALPSGNSMPTGVPASSADVLPVFASKSANLKVGVSGRTYTRSFDGAACASPGSSSTGSAIICITCHDPHGTASVYQEGERGPPVVYGTIGMTRRPVTDNWVKSDPIDPLCGQCHI